MEKKYKLTDESIDIDGVTLYRIEALRDFGCIKKGDKGGFVESENNLAHEGNAWVFGNACVYDNAWVSDNARVFDNSRVHDNARVHDHACVHDNARVYGDTCVCGSTNVCGDAEISTDADYIVFKNWWSSGRYFTWTRSNDMWTVGCFYGTGEELIKKAYKDSELSGREYERIVKYVEEIKKDNGI